MFSSKSRGCHSHIKGLGLEESTEASFSFVGHDNAREAASLVVEMVKGKRMAGRGILIVGPSGCGKTALAIAISEELGIKTPFNIINGSEVYSSEVKKTEVLHEALRKSILLRIKEYKNIYEGEVVSLNVIEQDNIAKEIEITLRATKGTKTFKISSQLLEQVNQQNIKKGDVVYIESSAGIIKKMGRGESHMNDYDLESEKYVPLPKGDIFRSKEVIQETTLHGLDLSFIRPTGQDVISLVSQVLSTKKTEITDNLRNEVDQMIQNYLEVGKVEVVPGVLFIDDASALDDDCFSYLHKAMDSPHSPIIIFASNKTEADGEKLFGISRDFVNKLLLIPLKKNSHEDETKIIQMRLLEEEVEISEDGLSCLLELSKTKKLRYCLSLLPLLKTFNHKITKKEVEEMSGLFSDC